MNNEVEFMSRDDGKVVLFTPSSVDELREGSELVEELYDTIARNFPWAFNALSVAYMASELNRSHYHYLIVRRFIRCNFGEYDTKEWDITPEGVWKLEKVSCPLRGECKMEGVVCGAKYHFGLSERETEILSLSAQGSTAREIAQTLSLSIFTVDTHLRNILAKLNAKNIKQVISWYNDNKTAD